ncbi:glycoside hydrolase family 3 N-terminal domain-containing protein [Brevirhabdus sp.]|uniref:glycoside hydrolase family 3 N-terminal domain-containing protein n=1 Tax=Brevirhabdus sp. TaxID=2004514 RepID=UPI004059B95B
MRHAACILGCEGPELGRAEAAFFARTQPWGFILFGRNIETPAQLRGLCAALRDAVGWQAPILIDQEGGRVERMGPPHWRHWSPALEDASGLESAALARAMWLRGRLIAADLADVGIDVNCAPLADLVEPETHPILKNRLYGGDVDTVVAAARALAEGQLAGGVLPVLKHLPGYGRAHVDSHKALPRTDMPRETLLARDFAPFRLLRDIRMGMTAHMVVSAYDEAPATCSAAVIDMIRRELGFDGLLMTDDISMRALSGSVAARSRDAIAAGCDLVLHCNGALEEMRAVADAAGALGTTAQTRASHALAQRRPPDGLDIGALEEERRRLIETRRLDG